MKLLDQLLKKNPDSFIKTVVLFKRDFNRETFSYHKFNELVKLCNEDDDYKDLVFVDGVIQKSLLGEDLLYCFVVTKDYYELFGTT